MIDADGGPHVTPLIAAWRDGALQADVFRVRPRTVHAFGKKPYFHVRWSF